MVEKRTLAGVTITNTKVKFQRNKEKGETRGKTQAGNVDGQGK